MEQITSKQTIVYQKAGCKVKCFNSLMETSFVIRYIVMQEIYSCYNTIRKSN